MCLYMASRLFATCRASTYVHFLHCSRHRIDCPRVLPEAASSRHRVLRPHERPELARRGERQATARPSRLMRDRRPRNRRGEAVLRPAGLRPASASTPRSSAPHSPHRTRKDVGYSGLIVQHPGGDDRPELLVTVGAARWSSRLKSAPLSSFLFRPSVLPAPFRVLRVHIVLAEYPRPCRSRIPISCPPFPMAHCPTLEFWRA